MDEPDARYLKLEVQEYLRQQAIRLRQQGKTFVSIGEYLGVHRNTVAQEWKQYQQRPEDALQQYVRGRQIGEGRSLSEHEETFVQRLLQEHFPEELKIDSVRVDAPCRARVNRSGVWRQDANSHSWGISFALGLYSPKTPETSV